MLRRYAALLPKVVVQPPRKLHDTERVAFLREMTSSLYGLPAAGELLRNPNAHVVEVQVDHVRALYVLQESAASARLLSKLKRAVARVAALNTPTLNYIIVPCPQKRFWPAINEPVGPENINGAFTYRVGTEVYVFREEEFPKVMLHEAIHHSSYDPSSSVLTGVEHLFRTSFNIAQDTRLLVNEGIVELVATHKHAEFVAYDAGQPFEKLWEREKEWMHDQAQRLLDRCMHGAKWRERSNAFAYIVIRWLCCENYEELLKLLAQTSQLLPFFEKCIKSHATRGTVKRDAAKRCGSMRLTVFGDF